MKQNLVGALDEFLPDRARQWENDWTYLEQADKALPQQENESKAQHWRDDFGNPTLSEESHGC
jgi:hypothetical protein